MDLHLEEKYLKYIHRVKKKWFPNPGKLMELFGNFRFLTGFQLEPWCFQQISLLWKWLRSDCQVSMSAETVLILLFPHMVISWISHLETIRNQSIIVYVLLPKRKLQGLFYLSSLSENSETKRQPDKHFQNYQMQCGYLLSCYFFSH